MKRKFILPLGMFLGGCLTAAAQTPTPRIVPAHDRTAPIVAMVLPAPAPSLATSLPLPGNPAIVASRTLPASVLAVSSPAHKNPADAAVHFSYVLAEPYKTDQGMDGLENQFEVEEVDTLFLTQMSLPLVQLWGGRLRLEGFTSALNVQNVQLGPSCAGGLRDFRPPRQDYPGAGPRSVDISGISVTLHFGRNAQIGRPAQIWRSAARILGAVQ